MKTVKNLIEELKKYDSDMPVVTIKNIEYTELCIKKCAVYDADEEYQNILVIS